MKHLAPDAAWQSLIRPAGGETFQPGMVADLPEPARRHLLHAIAPGTPLSTCVELEMQGRFRPKPKGKWLPMRAEEMLSHPGGFVWRAEVGGLIWIKGHDLYAAGEGHMEWRLWDFLPMLRTHGDDLSRSARGRLAAETAAWLPAALLPRFGARWEAIDAESAKVAFTVDEERHEVLLRLASSGAVQRFLLDRWGNHLTPRNEFALIPTAGVCTAEGEFDGYTIPTQLTATWWTGTPREFAFFEARVTHARYY